MTVSWGGKWMATYFWASVSSHRGIASSHAELRYCGGCYSARRFRTDGLLARTTTQKTIGKQFHVEDVIPLLFFGLYTNPLSGSVRGEA